MLRTFASNLKQTITDLLCFLRNPSDTPVPGIQVTGKLQVLLGVLVIDVLLTFVFMGLIHLVELLGWHKYDAHAVVEMIRSFPLWGALLLGIIIVPFAEELVFRAGLRFRRGYFTFLLFVLLLAAGIFAFNMMPLLWALGAAFVLGLLMIVYLMNAYAIGEFLERAWPRVYATVFYSVAVLFGLVHITNYTNFNYASLALLLIPVLIAPQIWAGLSIGYMRVKYGFFWGFFLHAAHNAVFLGTGLLFMSSAGRKTEHP